MSGIVVVVVVSEVLITRKTMDDGWGGKKKKKKKPSHTINENLLFALLQQNKKLPQELQRLQTLPSCLT
jgi:hypothetical protein